MDKNAPVDVIFARINTRGLISRIFLTVSERKVKKPDYSKVRIKSFSKFPGENTCKEIYIAAPL